MAAICPTDWQRYGESCYLLITKRLNWQDANDTCFKYQRSTLAVANSQTEQTFIWITFNDLFEWAPVVSLWIGCNDIRQEGKWEPCPLKDDLTRYNNWGVLYPRNNISKNCAIMGKWANGKWFDVDCDIKRNIVCELPAEATAPVFSLQTGPDGRVESQCLVGHVITLAQD
ncbi:snaclec GPIB-binding protein subunit beta-like [Asterias amurensis]|uniref:snaclec GPIB-binding protein subunit beta-like n=1 Tax=Asterias amurensis TaxID=7602 RepID=UPI003AB2B7AC